MSSGFLAASSFLSSFLSSFFSSFFSSAAGLSVDLDSACLDSTGLSASPLLPEVLLVPDVLPEEVPPDPDELLEPLLSLLPPEEVPEAELGPEVDELPLELLVLELPLDFGAALVLAALPAVEVLEVLEPPKPLEALELLTELNPPEEPRLTPT